MRRPRFRLKVLINILIFLMIIFLISSMNDNEIYETILSKLIVQKQKVKIKTQEDNKSGDYISRQEFIEFDRSSLVHPDLSPIYVEDVSKIKYVLFGTVCHYGCWGPSRTQKVGNCIFTAQRDLVKIHEFDAILFHVGEEWKVKRWFKIPPVRSYHQKYIMYTHESPVRLPFQNFELFHDFFNMTMTYRVDSDILWRYGRAKDKGTGKDVAPAMSVAWKLPPKNFTSKKHSKIIQGKSKMATVFVSNCVNAPSNRHGLVKELQKFISVDIFGNCGTPCPKYPLKCANLDHYWFYFAFENAICPDYVTEKVFNRFNQNAVIVVFNGAQMSKFLPPKTYIDANDFDTVEDLAQYLIYLTKNPHEYLKFFWWTREYEIYQWTRVDKAKICDALNTPASEFRRQSYRNMTAWFFQGCGDPKIKF